MTISVEFLTVSEPIYFGASRGLRRQRLRALTFILRSPGSALLVFLASGYLWSFMGRNPGPPISLIACRDLTVHNRSFYNKHSIYVKHLACTEFQLQSLAEPFELTRDHEMVSFWTEVFQPWRHLPFRNDCRSVCRPGLRAKTGCHASCFLPCRGTPLQEICGQGTAHSRTRTLLFAYLIGSKKSTTRHVPSALITVALPRSWELIKLVEHWSERCNFIVGASVIIFTSISSFSTLVKHDARTIWHRSLKYVDKGPAIMNKFERGGNT